MARDPTPGRSRAPEDAHDDGRDARRTHDGRRTVVLELDTFAWETLSEQATELGVPVNDLVAFSVLYYIADLDSKRIARRLPTDIRRSVDRD
jgi:hypothetical protein